LTSNRNGGLLYCRGSPDCDAFIPLYQCQKYIFVSRLEINGESIYGTSYWSTFGEGPTEIVEGAFTDVDRAPFTSEDMRFTYRVPHIYCNVLR